jgi:aldehyde dehydrogenase (NAD+)
MLDYRQHYINGQWVDPAQKSDFSVVNPATEQEIAVISLGSTADVDRAVAAANQAFAAYSETTADQRIAYLRRIVEVYEAKQEEMAQAISREMGAPITLSRTAQVPSGVAHFKVVIDVLSRFEFEKVQGSTLMRHEAIGPCGLITPWNWPMNQVAAKVAPALAAGCTMVLKPSERAPLSGHLFAQVLHEAGLPAGVFNLVNGDGPGVGSALANHQNLAMISFTGSTRAGIAVAQNAAPSVKRVTQELGGKSAFIVLEDADLSKAVKGCTQACFRNTGQSCNAPTRLLVPQAKMTEAADLARAVAEGIEVGDPLSDSTEIGPLANQPQFDKVQRMIGTGISEGARLAAGGAGRPAGLDHGYFVRPTVFADVRNDMTIAREEIFGPVLTILGYSDEDDAVRIANDTPYGLAGYVNSSDLDHARRVARRIRAGNVHVNGARLDFAACFGGYKQSGNGREWGASGLEEFLELKAVFGYAPAPR